MFQQIINKAQPKQLFLIDGFGALLSAFLLGVVLVRFQHLIGIPVQTLYILASIPIIFVIYDFICYFRLTENWNQYLKGIAIANLIYCCISIGFLIYHYPVLTNLGWLYFLGELMIVITLVFIEIKVANK